MPDWYGLPREAIGPGVSAILAYGVGNRLTAYWSVRQKRRESALVLGTEFSELYGEFFSVWKLWNAARDDAERGAPSDQRWSLLERAAAAEGRMEALVVTLAAEQRLSARDVEVLAKFRQGYQRLRETIRDGQRLPWHSSEHREYVAFKLLAVECAALISHAGNRRPSATQAQESLRRITSNQWERCWTEVLPREQTRFGLRIRTARAAALPAV